MIFTGGSSNPNSHNFPHQHFDPQGGGVSTTNNNNNNNSFLSPSGNGLVAVDNNSSVAGPTSYLPSLGAPAAATPYFYQPSLPQYHSLGCLPITAASAIPTETGITAAANYHQHQQSSDLSQQQQQHLTTATAQPFVITYQHQQAAAAATIPTYYYIASATAPPTAAAPQSAAPPLSLAPAMCGSNMLQQQQQQMMGTTAAYYGSCPALHLLGGGNATVLGAAPATAMPPSLMPASQPQGASFMLVPPATPALGASTGSVYYMPSSAAGTYPGVTMLDEVAKESGIAAPQANYNTTAAHADDMVASLSQQQQQQTWPHLACNMTVVPDAMPSVDHMMLGGTAALGLTPQGHINHSFCSQGSSSFLNFSTTLEETELSSVHQQLNGKSPATGGGMLNSTSANESGSAVAKSGTVGTTNALVGGVGGSAPNLNRSKSGSSRRIYYYNNILYKTTECNEFVATGHCPRRHKCQFAHGKHDLRTPAHHPLYRTSLCREFLETGVCPRGVSCYHAHRESELKGRSSRPLQVSATTSISGGQQQLTSRRQRHQHSGLGSTPSLARCNSLFSVKEESPSRVALLQQAGRHTATTTTDAPVISNFESNSLWCQRSVSISNLPPRFLKSQTQPTHCSHEEPTQTQQHNSNPALNDTKNQSTQ